MVGMSANSMLGFKDLPEDHRLRRPYRVAVAVIGVVLLVFGVMGFFAGNGLLSVLSVVAGVVLLTGVVVDGNVDAYVNTLAGGIFMGAGLASMAFLRTSYNYLGFTIWNVIFSFVVGMILFAAGLYGRVSE